MNPFDQYPGITINGDFYSRKDLLRYKNSATTSRSNADQALEFAAELFSESEALEVTTSGSTGKPKVLCFKKTAFEISACATNTFFNLGKRTRAALPLPVKYIAGKMMVVRAITGNYSLHVFEPTSLPLPDFPVDFMPVIPMQLEACFEKTPGRIANVGTYLIGGSNAESRLREKIAVAGLEAWYSFGMTETLSHFALAKANTGKEALYQPLSGVAIGTDETSRLTVNWPGMTKGILQTNDLVEIMPEGFVWLGRSDNLINSGGIKIIPERVEAKLALTITTPFFVAGVPHPRLGEEVVLFAEDEKVSIPTGLDWTTPYEIPRRTVCIPVFERTLSGKIKRKATVEKWIADGI